MSPVKLRLVANLIKKLPVAEALDQLQFINKLAARPVAKLVKSAIANAEHNDGADIDELKVATIMVDQGPTLKRLQTRARGRADRILKPMSHVTVTVAETSES